MNEIPGSIGLLSWRRQLFRRILTVFASAGLLALLPSLFASVETERWLIFGADVATYLAVLVLLFARKKAYLPRAVTFIAIMTSLSVLLIVQLGVEGAGTVWLFATLVLATLLLGLPSGLAAGIVSVVAVTVCVWLSGPSAPLRRLPLPLLLVHVGNFVAASAAALLSLSYLVRRIGRSYQREHNLRRKLADKHGELQRANEQLLEHLARQEELARELSHRVKNNLQLLSSLVNLADETGGDPGLTALEEYRRRVNILALVHEHFYNEIPSATVSAFDLLTRVERYVQGGLQQSTRCRLIVETDEISPDEGGPLALLVGEIFIAWAESGNGKPHTLRVKRLPDSDNPAPRVWQHVSAEEFPAVSGSPSRNTVIAALVEQLGARLFARSIESAVHIELTLPPGRVR